MVHHRAIQTKLGVSNLSVNRVSQKDELFRLLVSHVTDYAIFALDPNGIIMTWNEGAKRIKGYSEEEIVGKHFSIFYSEEDVKSGKAERELTTARREGRFEEEGWRYKKDGTAFWANVVLTPIYDDAGDLVSYAKITRDLTERLRAEERLRRSEEAFRVMVESVKDYAIFLLDKEGNILTWNEGAHRIKGYTAAEVVGKNFTMFYPQEARDRHHPEFELKQAVEAGYYAEEGWRVRKDGVQIWASVTITPVFDETRTLRGFLKVTRDLTDRRQNELNLEHARDEAISASMLKSQFVANVSHEVRTPLAGIIGMAEILRDDDALDADQKESAEHIFMASQRLLEVLNDILDFSKLEAGRATYEEDRFSTRALVAEVLASIMPPAEKKGIVVHTSIAESVPEFVLGDESKLRQCLMNFAHNAVKFTLQGTVELMVSIEFVGELKKDPNLVPLHVVVRDSGIGIAEAMRGKLFKPFVQADGSDKRKFAGTGLGLSIVKGYVEIMQGDCGLSSVPGTGSTFWLTVPVKKG